MKLEINQTHYRTPQQNHNQKMQESFNHHVNELNDCIITGINMELTTQPAVYHNGYAMFHPPERRIFTYEGYTQSGKRFSLTIDE